MMSISLLNIIIIIIVLNGMTPFVNCIKMQINPKDQVLELYTGNVFTAECTIVDYEDRPTNHKVARWLSPRGDRVSLRESDRVMSEVDENNMFLVIRSLEPSDAGTWRCESDFPPLTASIKIKLQSKPTIEANDQELAPINKRHLIKCTVRSEHEVRVSWRKQDRPTNIEHDDPDYEITPLGLAIKQVKMSDNNTFYCMAETLHTGYYTDKAIQVLVSKSVSKPYINCITTPCALEKAFSILYCHSDGLPSPKFEWIYNQQIINVAFNNVSLIGTYRIPDHSAKLLGRYTIKHGTDRKYYLDNNALTISNLSKADSGLYECRSFNDYDKTGQRSGYNLDVVVPPLIEPMHSLSMKMNAVSSSTNQLTCNVSSRSTLPLKFTWYKDGQRIDHSNLNDVRVDSGISVSHLQFLRASKEHFGLYECEASNEAGIHKSQTKVTVEFAPMFDNTMPTIYYGVDGREVNMSCAFNGYPIDDVIWTNRNMEYLNAEYVSSSGGGFKVLNIYDFNENAQRVSSTITLLTTSLHTGTDIEIQCSVSGNEGTWLRLRRASRPNKLDASMPPIIYPERIIFFVKLPSDTGGLPIESVLIKYKEIKNPSDPLDRPFQHVLSTIKNRTIESELVELSLSGLKTNTLYRLALQAISGAGESEPYMNLFRTRVKTGPFFELFAPSVLSTNNATGSHLNKGFFKGNETFLPVVRSPTLNSPSVFSTNERIHPKQKGVKDGIYSCHHHEFCSIRWRVVSNGGDELKSIEITYSTVNPKTFAKTGKERIVKVPNTLWMSEHLLINLTPLSIYQVKIAMTNKADLSSERVFLVGTTHPPVGYNQKYSKNTLAMDSSSSSATSVWKLLNIIFGSSLFVFISIIVAAYFCCRRRQTTMPISTSRRGDANLFPDEHRNDFDFSVNSTLLDRREQQHHRKQQEQQNGTFSMSSSVNNNNNNRTHQSSLTNSLLKDANVNPLYTDANGMTSAPWNVFSSSPRSSGSRGFGRNNNGFSRV